MIRVFVPEVPDAGTLELGGGEARYLVRVRRAVAGERLELRDHRGRGALAVVEDLRGGHVSVRVLGGLPDAPPPPPVHLLVAVPKRNLFDDVVRGASELGASRLTPVLAARSVMRPGAGRLERWRRIAGESMRQCGRREAIRLDAPAGFAEALELADPRSRKLLLDPSAAAAPLARALSDRGEPPFTGGPVSLAVGPEGGFDGGEIDEARARGFLPVRLGDAVLRVETAALAAVAVAIALAEEARDRARP